MWMKLARGKGAPTHPALILLLFALLGLGNRVQGQTQLHLSQQSRFSESTVASLPSSNNWIGRPYVVTDGASEADCTAGGGSVRVLCTWDGSAWAAASGTEYRFSVRDFGATGDGVTNDTAAFETTIAAAQAVDGTIYMPRGTYCIDDLDITDNIDLVGEGPNVVTLLACGSTSGTEFVDYNPTTANVPGAVIGGFTIDLDGSTTLTGLRIRDYWDSYVRDIRIEDGGIALEIGDDDGSTDEGVGHVYFTGIFIKEPTIGGVLVHGDNSAGLYFTNVNIRNIAVTGGYGWKNSRTTATDTGDFRMSSVQITSGASGSFAECITMTSTADDTRNPLFGDHVVCDPGTAITNSTGLKLVNMVHVSFNNSWFGAWGTGSSAIYLDDTDRTYFTTSAIGQTTGAGYCVRAIGTLTNGAFVSNLFNCGNVGYQLDNTPVDFRYEANNYIGAGSITNDFDAWTEGHSTETNVTGPFKAYTGPSIDEAIQIADGDSGNTFTNITRLDNSLVFLNQAGSTNLLRIWDNGAVSPASVTFANLPTTTVSNGMMIYCSDCTDGSPCTGSGTGAHAFRQNGAWNCK